MKNKNAGMSIVEMVIVIAIIAVVTGISAYGIGQVSGYRARECANGISSSLSECKVTTLGKAKATGGIWWELYQNDGKVYVKTTYDNGTEKIEKVGDSGVSVSYSGTGMAGGTSISTASLKLCFNRSSGALHDYTSPGGASTAVTTKNKIVVSSGNKSYTIDLYPATGKVKGTF